MSAALGPSQIASGPSLTRQIVRPTVITLSIVLLGALIYSAAVNGQAFVSSVWWRIAGDPSVVLADGAPLSTTPPQAVTPVLVDRPVSLVGDLDALAAPLGGTAVVLPADVDLLSQAPWANPSLARADGTLARPLALLPTGLLRVDDNPGPIPAAVHFWGGPDAPVAATAVEQKALVARLGEAYASLAGGRVPLTAVPSAMPTEGGAMWQLGYSLPGCAECRISTYDLVTFDAQGRLVSASLSLVGVERTEPLAVSSPLQAFEDARHHVGDGFAAGWGGPVTSATLTVADIEVPQQQPYWTLLDAGGYPVAQTPAATDDVSVAQVPVRDAG